MTPNLTVAVVAGVMIACGVYLLTERSLTRILVGLMVASNGINLLFLVAAGEKVGAPIIGLGTAEERSDSLPQAMVLTAIVITMGVSAFVMAMAYRSFQLNCHYEVKDDVEDARIRALAASDEASGSFEEIIFTDTGADRVSER